MRRAVVLLLVGAAVLLGAAPAFAHEEINPSTIVIGKPVFFTLSAANESTADLNKITLAAAPGVAFGATTKQPSGWTVNRTDTLITWTGGAVKPNLFDQWGFEIEGADQPGTLAYKVTLGYSDGKSDDVTVDVTATTPTTAGAKTSGSSSGRANAALTVGIVSLVLAAVALGLAASGRRRGTPSASTAPADAVANDW